MTSRNPHDALTEQMHQESHLKLECAALKDDLEKLSRAYDELLFAAEMNIIYQPASQVRE